MTALFAILAVVTAPSAILSVAIALFLIFGVPTVDRAILEPVTVAASLAAPLIIPSVSCAPSYTLAVVVPFLSVMVIVVVSPDLSPLAHP